MSLILFKDIAKIDDFMLGNQLATVYVKEHEHGLPHVHIKVDNVETVFDIHTGEKIQGTLSGRNLITVRNWILTHHRKLSRYWNKHSGGRKIEFTRYSKRKKNLRSQKRRTDDWYDILFLAKIIAINGGLYGAKLPEMF